MQLKAVALEPLGLVVLSVVAINLLAGRCDRIAEHRQATVLFPEAAEAPADTLTSLGKAARVVGHSRARTRCCQYETKCEQGEQVDAAYSVVHRRPPTALGAPGMSRRTNSERNWLFYEQCSHACV